MHCRYQSAAVKRLSVRVSDIGLTQQASVRRGPRASATSLFTVSLPESEVSAFFPNGVCVSLEIVAIVLNLIVYHTLYN